MIRAFLFTVTSGLCKSQLTHLRIQNTPAHTPPTIIHSKGSACVGLIEELRREVFYCWHALWGAVCGVMLGPGVAAVGLTPRYGDVIAPR